MRTNFFDLSACFGDSGGPLTVNNELIGITSWVLPCARGAPDGYTRVGNYLDWIKSKLEAFQEV